MSLKIGPYRKVYEAHLKYFHSYGYPELEAAALARSTVAQPLPEVALACASGYLADLAFVFRFLKGGLTSPPFFFWR
jgi:hypothetical protein